MEYNLNQLLSGLGMPTAFTPGAADFSAMITGGGPWIETVFHEATIDVNEQGTKAAAATEVELALCFAAGTPVLTPDGEKPIEQLTAGDVVLARDEHNLEGPVEQKIVEESLSGHAELVDLHVRGRVIRATEPHPFFIEGRGWTPAGKLQAGDRVSTHQFDWVEIGKVVKTNVAAPVYNIRVADHHTYFVGSKEWGFAVWTHNYYDYHVNRPFHFLIRDNVTSTITFMGRVNDPSQLQNTVDPTFTPNSAASGDYDNDGNVDDDDYDVWKDAFGQTGSGLAADGNGNGVVDMGDYTLWVDNYGKTLASQIQAGSDPPMPATDTDDSALSPIAIVESDETPTNAELSNRKLSTTLISEDDLLLLAVSVARPSAARFSDSPASISRDAEFESAEHGMFAALPNVTGLFEPTIGEV